VLDISRKPHMTKVDIMPSLQPTGRWRAWLLLVLILLAFFAFWLWDLGYPSLSGDEAFIANLAPRSTGEILQRLNSDEPHPPLYYLLMHGWSSVVGMRPEFNVRLPSLFLGLLLLSLTYRLARDLGLGRYSALLPTVMLGFFPHVVVHLREARMYSLMLASLAFMLVIALRFERLPRRLNVLIMATATLLPLLTHYFTAPFVAVIGLWGLFSLRKGLRLRWFISQAMAWLALAIWLPLLGRGFFNPTSLSEGRSWSFILPPWETLVRIVKTALVGYRDTADIGWLLLGGVILVGGAWLGAMYYPKPKRWLLFGGMTLPVLAYALLCWFKPVFHQKYVVPWLLFAALGFAGLIVRCPRLGSVAYVCLLMLMFAPMYNTVRRPYLPFPVMANTAWLRPWPRELAQAISTYRGPYDVFGMGTPDNTHCYYEQYYFERDMGCELIPLYPAQSVTEIGAQLDGLFRQHPILWYLDFYNPGWDPNHVADAAFAQYAVELGEERTASQLLKLYTNPATIRREMQVTEAIFSDTVKLKGVWIAPRHDVYVVLAWQALVDEPPLDAKVFVHLIDGTGQIVSQLDGVPVRWTRPFRSWQQGEELLDVYALSLPDDVDVKQLSLRVGVYNPETGARVPVSTRSGERQPDDAVVLPVRDALSIEEQAK
jgi:hypothetical protein